MNSYTRSLLSDFYIVAVSCHQCGIWPLFSRAARMREPEYWGESSLQSAESAVVGVSWKDPKNMRPGPVCLCHPKPSGNMPAGRAPPPGITRVIRRTILIGLDGMTKILAEHCIRWAQKNRMRSDCMICMAMCLSGAATGMRAIIMRRVRRRIPRGLSQARTAFFAAVRGASGARDCRSAYRYYGFPRPRH